MSRSGESAPFPTFFGRARELDELRARLAEALGKRGSLVVVHGGAGIGKTRLATALCAEAESRGIPVARGRASADGGAPPLWAWIQVFRSRLRGAVAPAVAALPAALGDASMSGDATDGARFALFDRATQVVKGLAEPHGLIIVLDDLQHADPSSLLLLRFLAREIHEARVLLIAVHRAPVSDTGQSTAETLVALAREGRSLSLQGLTLNELESWMASRNEGRDGIAAPELHRLTEGNPLYVEAILRGRPQVRRSDGGGWILPPEVRDLVRVRLNRLAPADAEVLSIAAISEREVDLALLASVSGRPQQQVLETLDRAEVEGLAVSPAGSPPRLRFAQPLIREALYAEIPPARRLTLHRAFGEAIERAGTGEEEARLAELAYHFFEASSSVDVRERALRYAVRAADAATARREHGEAIRHLRHALELVETPSGPDLPSRCRLLIELGACEARVGDHPAARSTLRRAVAVGRSTGSDELFATAVHHLAREVLAVELSPFGSRGDEALAHLLGEALARLPEGDGDLRAKLYGELAVARGGPPTEERSRLCEHAREIAQRIGSDEALVIAAGARRLVRCEPDELDARIESAREMLAAAERGGAWGDAMIARSWLFTDCLERGDIALVDRELDRLHALAELSSPIHRWHAGLARATRAKLRGDYEAGAALADEALGIGRGIRGAWASAVYGMQRLRPLAERARHAELEGTMAAVLAQAGEKPAVRAALCWVLCEVGKREAARALFEELARNDFDELPRDSSWTFTVSVLAEVTARLADADRAVRLHAMLSPFEGRWVVLGPPPVTCWGPVSLYAGLAASAAHLHEAAEATLLAAIEASESVGAAPFAARSAFELGRILAERPGSAAAAVAQVTRAAEGAARLGMHGLLGQAEALASRLAAPGLGGAPASAARSFRKRDRTWEIAYGDERFSLADGKGLLYLAELLRHPGTEIPVARLAALGEAKAPVFDTGARERLGSLREELEQAEEWEDSERAERLRDEIQREARGVVSSYGLDPAERAEGTRERVRKAVTGRIRDTIKRIRAVSEGLGAHLENSIRTGILCCYEPERPESWEC